PAPRPSSSARSSSSGGASAWSSSTPTRSPAVARGRRERPWFEPSPRSAETIPAPAAPARSTSAATARWRPRPEDSRKRGALSRAGDCAKAARSRKSASFAKRAGYSARDHTHAPSAVQRCPRREGLRASGAWRNQPEGRDERNRDDHPERDPGFRAGGGRCHGGPALHARDARGGRALRASDPALESEDAALHLRSPQRHPHHRPAADGRYGQQGPPLRGGYGRPRRHGALRRHQEAGSGRRRRGGASLQPVLRDAPLARRHLDKLQDDQAGYRAPQEPGKDAGR